jgi:hypothetical protein
VALGTGGGRRRLVGDPRKRDSGRGFNSGLVWEKESEEGNASTGLRRGAGGQGRRTTARCGGETPASNRARGNTGNRGERAGEDPHPKAELRLQLAAIAERQGGGYDGDRNAAAMAAARASRARGGGCGFDGF